MTGETFIERFRPEHTAAIRDICFETGFAGETLRGIIDNKEFFADLVTGYFTHEFTGGTFAAVRGGRVIGYLFCCPDEEKHAPAIEQHYRSRIIRELPRLGRFTRSDAAFFAREAMSFIGGEMNFPPFTRDYTSALHINVLPVEQRTGAGALLFDTMFRYLEGLGSRGVHLQTTSLNTKALPFYIKHGFTELFSKKTRFYRKWTSEEVRNVILGRKLPR